MTPKSLAAHIDRRFREFAELSFGEGQRRFFQHEVSTYGVRTVNVHAVVREVSREVKTWPVAQRDELMELLWRKGKLESDALVCHVYRRFAKQCGEREFRLFESWIDRFVSNWAAADGVASWLLSASMANRPELLRELKSWTASKNRWRRRCAAVALLQEAKNGRHTETILEVADLLIADRDDMVEKGIGWLLKEAYPKKPREIAAWLEANRHRASRTALRYAAEKMTAADKRRVLARSA